MNIKRFLNSINKSMQSNKFEDVIGFFLIFLMIAALLTVAGMNEISRTDNGIIDECFVPDIGHRK